MNEIFQTINQTYNFDQNLSDNILGKFKICEFKNGEIFEKDVLKEGMGEKNYETFLSLGESSDE